MTVTLIVDTFLNDTAETNFPTDIDPNDIVDVTSIIGVNLTDTSEVIFLIDTSLNDIAEGNKIRPGSAAITVGDFPFFADSNHNDTAEKLFALTERNDITEEKSFVAIGSQFAPLHHLCSCLWSTITSLSSLHESC